MRFIFLFLMVLSFAPAFADTVTLATPTAVTETTTSTKILNVNSRRGYLIVVNTGSVTVYLKPNAVQSGNEGVPIPAGGSYEPIQAPSNAFWIISASSTAAVTVMEGNY